METSKFVNLASIYLRVCWGWEVVRPCPLIRDNIVTPEHLLLQQMPMLVLVAISIIGGILVLLYFHFLLQERFPLKVLYEQNAHTKKLTTT